MIKNLFFVLSSFHATGWGVCSRNFVDHEINYGIFIVENYFWATILIILIQLMDATSK
jgi:hypothetical protein